MVTVRKLALLGIFIVVFVVGGAVLIGTVLWTRITEPYKGYAASEQFVEIQPGSSAVDIRRGLVSAGIIRDDLTARAALSWTRQASRLKAGEYHFDRPMSAVDVIGKIARGDVYTRRLTFREGLTIAEMADVYAENGFGEAAAFVRAANDATLIRDLDPGARDLEGYLFPETYTLSRTTSASDLIAMMVAGFKRNAPDASSRAAEQGFTVRQIVTLASLVEKETGRADERPLVAAVYRNRLKLKMGMQADPTVVYALQKAGRYDGNIRRADLSFDSPYNTYRYPGLPPGPIAAPGKAAIEAALAPADVGFLYFVSRNDGSHVFAETLAQHNANVYEYQVAYFRKQRK
jgi:peptidoglycan lytic transglycosylase G